MIKRELFHKTEPDMLRLVTLWNAAEAEPLIYEKLFTANAHELAALIGNKTTYDDWQNFLVDARVQDYIDRVIYVMAGNIVSRFMSTPTAKVGMADTAKLKAAIDYRDTHKPDFAQPTQYIYMHIPLSPDEMAFLSEEGKPDEL
jgi:hypothetical protein